MMLGIGMEAAIFLYAGLTGIVTFSCYQFLKLFRQLIRHNIIVINIEDFLYWLGISAYVFRQMYYTTYGSIRWFFVLGIVCGNFFAYFVVNLLKKLFLKWKKSLEKEGQNR
ncbi:spore cortex biosynthesis protein YabQ [Mediterraneibacter agrestimuris]|uniref:spore cortex biosynthesis protein YabQ n=1 Tax=Mediterraneibacter agrestimuris TaxID=2941333 RepID=UPI002041D830|nr:spore cortex biosynthesis protein YabQ [Mediterraneibacter agrestimuris]